MRSFLKSFDSLYQLCADDLYHYIVTLSDATLAKDIAQQTWVKVINNPQGYHTNGSVKAWLFRVSRNALIDELRKTKKLMSINDELQSDMSIEGMHVERLFHTNIEEAFDQALSSLPFHQKEAFCLQQEGFSLADIAYMTNSNKETIKTRLRYARKNLQHMLEKINE